MTSDLPVVYQASFLKYNIGSFAALLVFLGVRAGSSGVRLSASVLRTYRRMSASLSIPDAYGLQYGIRLPEKILFCVVLFRERLVKQLISSLIG